MDKTEKLGLNLPKYNEYADVELLNENFGILDAEVAKKAGASELNNLSGEIITELDQLGAQLQALDAVATSIVNTSDLIKSKTDLITNATYGLSAINTKVTDAQTKVTDVQSKINNGTYGLAAINNNVLNAKGDTFGRTPNVALITKSAGGDTTNFQTLFQLGNACILGVAPINIASQNGYIRITVNGQVFVEEGGQYEGIFQRIKENINPLFYADNIKVECKFYNGSGLTNFKVLYYQ